MAETVNVPALLAAVKAFVSEGDAAVEQSFVTQLGVAAAEEAAQREAALDAVRAQLAAAEETVGALRASLSALESSSRKPHEQAAAVVRSAHRVVEQAADVWDGQRRHARAFLLAEAALLS